MSDNAKIRRALISVSDKEGIVALAPAYKWTHELGARWIRIAQLMYPDPSQIAEPVIDSAALKLIGDAVMAQCDALDGLSDGVLNDPRQCDFDVSSLACGGATSSSLHPGSRTPSCLRQRGTRRRWRVYS